MGKSKGRKKKKSARNGPLLVSEFCRTATALLGMDYGGEYKMFRISTRSAHPVAFHSISATMYERRLVTAVDSVFNHGNTSLIVHLDTKSKISANLRLSKQIMPSTAVTASLRLPNFSTKISANYSSGQQQLFPSLRAKASLGSHGHGSCSMSFLSIHRHASLATQISVNRSLELAFQASLGTQSLAVGTQITYRTGSSSFQPWIIGIRGTHHSNTASILYSAKGHELRATFIHSLDKEKNISAAFDISQSLSTRRTTFAAAGSWPINHRTAVKARIDHHGTLKTLLRHKIGDTKSLLSISGKFDIKDLKKRPRIGLAIVLLP